MMTFNVNFFSTINKIRVDRTEVYIHICIAPGIYTS
jgi:hypothetical protein